MNYKKVTTIIIIILSILSLFACKKKLSMEEQAWQEAITYIDWFADKNDVDLKPGVYSVDRVEKNSDANYTCCVAITNSKGAYDQWYITVEKKMDGDWEVLSID